ncbi:MAG: hypothetical protein ACOCUI_03405 [bacterium]
MIIIKPRYNRSNPVKEREEVRNKFIELFKRESKDTPYKTKEINSIITSSETIKNPLIHSSHNRWCGN